MCTGNDAQDFALVDVTDAGSDQARDRAAHREMCLVIIYLSSMHCQLFKCNECPL